MVDRQRCLLAAGIQLVISLQGILGNTVEVETAQQLRDAVDDIKVDTIFLVDSVRLRPYNGWDIEKNGPIPLGRSLTVRGDDQWEKHITIDFSSLLSGHQRNLMVFEPTRTGLSLTFDSVHLVGLPFVAANISSSIFSISIIYESSIIETYTSGTESPDWIPWLLYPRPEQYPISGSESQIIRPVEKRFCDEWCKVECPIASYVYIEDAAFYSGHHNQTYVAEIGKELEDTGVFRAWDSMLLFVNISEYTVSTTNEFHNALASSQDTNTVIVIEEALSLQSPRLDCPMTISSNVVIKGLTNNVPPVDRIDFQLIMNCSIINTGYSVRLENLLLINSAIDSPNVQQAFPWQALVGFFAPKPGATLSLDNVVWDTQYVQNSPLSTGSISGDLTQRQRKTQITVPGALDTSVSQDVTVVDKNWCTSIYVGGSQTCLLDKDCLQEARCPEGGVFVEDVKYNFSVSAWDGDAVYKILHSLLVPKEVQGKLPESQPPSDDGTPQFIVIMLVVLGIMGFGVAAAALILSKLRSKATDVTIALDEERGDKPGSQTSNNGFVGDAKGYSSAQQSTNRPKSNAEASSKSRFSLAAQKAAEKMFGNIVLGDLLGQGGFGRVYKAAWNGAVVAVKVIEMVSEDPSQESSIEREVSLLLELRHPNIVNLYRAARRPLRQSASADATPVKETVQTDENTTPGSISSGSNPPTVGFEGNTETWMVMEYCDQGTLRDLLRNQFFFTDSDNKTVNMQHALYTCQDIARGFQYLHEQSMMHGDLKPHNILLQTSGQDSRGFIAKLADFGVSRKLQGSQMYTGTVGTMTYMPPELLGEGKISNKTDVYAFGLIMWQLITCETPFVHVTPAEVWRKVVIENYRPEFPGGIPEDYKNLASSCWDADPKKRPSFDDVQNQLGVLLRKA